MSDDCFFIFCWVIRPHPLNRDNTRTNFSSEITKETIFSLLISELEIMSSSSSAFWETTLWDKLLEQLAGLIEQAIETYPRYSKLDWENHWENYDEYMEVQLNRAAVKVGEIRDEYERVVYDYVFERIRGPWKDLYSCEPSDERWILATFFERWKKDLYDQAICGSYRGKFLKQTPATWLQSQLKAYYPPIKDFPMNSALNRIQQVIDDFSQFFKVNPELYIRYEVWHKVEEGFTELKETTSTIRERLRLDRIKRTLGRLLLLENRGRAFVGIQSLKKKMP